MTTSPRSLPLVALVLAIGVIVIEARIVAGGQTWDDATYHAQIAPPRLAAASAIQRGALPAWWDGSGLGVPLWAEPSHGAAYPPLWLAATPRALDWMLVLHVFWAALGVAVWARRRSSEQAALVAGVLAATTGVVASAALRGALPALAHLPWIGWAAATLGEASARRDRARAAIALGALVGATALAGQLGVLGDALALALALAARRGAWRWLCPALAAGLAIGAAQWLPAAYAIAAGAGAGHHALPLARLVELIVPGQFGASDPDRAVAAIAGAHAWAPSLYVGAPLVALALVRRADRRLLVVAALYAALALVVGRGTWPAWLGAPELHVGALALVGAAHAAVGIDALVAGVRRARLAIAGAAAITAIALVGIAVLRAVRGDGQGALAHALIDGALGVLCMAGCAALVWRRGGGAWRAPVVLALIVAPSVGAIPLVQPAIERATVDQPGAWASAAIAAVAPPRRLFWQPERLRDTADAIAGLAGTSAARWGIDDARDPDPARPPAFDRTWDAAGHEGDVMLERYGIGLAVLPASVAAAGAKQDVLGERGGEALVRYHAAPPAAVMVAWNWIRPEALALARLFPPGGGGRRVLGFVVLAGDGVPEEETAAPPLPCAI
ncbi:MAG TPA: hypothetical protein VLX92_34915, partial [Kofleriaceae bacterium]|nr:hypothetical protein [Kofleriaceae bacterium]